MRGSDLKRTQPTFVSCTPHYPDLSGYSNGSDPTRSTVNPGFARNTVADSLNGEYKQFRGYIRSAIPRRLRSGRCFFLILKEFPWLSAIAMNLFLWIITFLVDMEWGPSISFDVALSPSLSFESCLATRTPIDKIESDYKLDLLMRLRSRIAVLQAARLEGRRPYTMALLYNDLWNHVRFLYFAGFVTNEYDYARVMHVLQPDPDGYNLFLAEHRNRAMHALNGNSVSNRDLLQRAMSYDPFVTCFACEDAKFQSLSSFMDDVVLICERKLMPFDMAQRLKLHFGGVVTSGSVSIRNVAYLFILAEKHNKMMHALDGNIPFWFVQILIGYIVTSILLACGFSTPLAIGAVCSLTLVHELSKVTVVQMFFERVGRRTHDRVSGFAEYLALSRNRLMHALTGNIDLGRLFFKLTIGCVLTVAEIEYVQTNSISRKIVRHYYPAFTDQGKVGLILKSLKKIRLAASRDAAYLRSLRRYDVNNPARAKRAARALAFKQVVPVLLPEVPVVPPQRLMVKQNDRFAELDLDATMSDVRDVYNYALKPSDRSFTRKEFISKLRVLEKLEKAGAEFETQGLDFLTSAKTQLSFLLETKFGLWDPLISFTRKPAEILGDVFSLFSDIYAAIKLQATERLVFLTGKLTAWSLRFVQWIKDDTPVIRLATWLTKLIKASFEKLTHFETQGDEEHPLFALFNLFVHMITGHGGPKLNEDRARRLNTLFGCMNTLHTFCTKFWHVLVEALDYITVTLFDHPFFGPEPEELRKKLVLAVPIMREFIKEPPLEMTVEYAIRITTVYDQIEPLAVEIVVNSEIASRWIAWTNYFKRFELLVLRAKNFLNSSNLRQVPIFWIYTGGSGLGKSMMISKISHDLQVLHYGKAQPLFARSIDESSLKYWEGYERQPVVYYEELFSLDDKDLTRVVCGECVKIVSPTRFVVPMAAVEHKGNTDFTSKIVLGTTNLPQFIGTQSGLAFPGAMARRWRWCKVEIDPKFHDEFDFVTNKWKVPLGDEAYKRYLYSIHELHPTPDLKTVKTVQVAQCDYAGMLRMMDDEITVREDDYKRLLAHTMKMNQADLEKLARPDTKIPDAVLEVAQSITPSAQAPVVDESVSSPASLEYAVKQFETQGLYNFILSAFSREGRVTALQNSLRLSMSYETQMARLELAGEKPTDFLDLEKRSLNFAYLVSHLPRPVVAMMEADYEVSFWGNTVDSVAFRNAVVDEYLGWKLKQSHTDYVYELIQTVCPEPELKPFVSRVKDAVFRHWKLLLGLLIAAIAGSLYALWYFVKPEADESQSGNYEKSHPRGKKAKGKLRSKVAANAKVQGSNGPIITQTSDSSLDDQLDVVARAYTRVTLIDGDGTPCVVMGKLFCVAGDVYVTNMHFLDPILDKNGEIDQKASLFLDGRRAIRFADLSYVMLEMDDVEQDYIFIRIPETKWSKGRDLTSYFFLKDDFDGRELGNVVKSTPRWNGACATENVRTGVWRGSFERRAEKPVVATSDNETFEYSTSHAILYDLKTKKGDCMDIYSVANPKSARKFFGFHVAGVGEKAACAVICQEWIRYAVDQLCGTGGVGVTQGEVLVFDGCPKPLAIQRPVDFRFVPEGFDAFASIPEKKYWNVPPLESQIVRTELFPYAEIERKPAQLFPLNGEHPLKNSIARAGCVDCENKSPYRKLVQDAVQRQFDSAVSLCTLPGLLSVEEAMNAHINATGLVNLRFTTSPGFGCRESGKTGKAAYMTENAPNSKFAFCPTALMYESIKYVEDYILLHRKMPIIPYNLTMKDELRELPKVTRPRLFFAGNVVLLTIMRMYFGAFMDTFLSNPMKFKHAIGLDINGPFGQHLPHVVRDDVACYDIKKNDLTLWRYKIVDAWDRALEFMQKVDEKEFRQLGWIDSESVGELKRRHEIRKVLVSMHLDWYFVIFGTLVKADHGMPSGDPFTTIFNSLIDHCEFLENMLHLCRGRHPAIYEKMLHDPEFLWTCPGFNFGDDLVAHSLGFTLEEYQKAGAELHSREYTAADKDRGIPNTVGQLFFLSRVPIESHGRIHYILPERTIDAVPLYRWRSVVPDSQMYPILCEAALSEWFHYGQERFSLEKRKYDAELNRLGYKPTVLSWSKAMSDWQSHHM